MPRPAKAEHHCILSVWISRKNLLGRLATVDAKERNGCTPLYYACDADGYFTKKSERGRLATARILIGFGANVNASDHGGYIPLMMLTRSSSGDGGSIAQLLMSRGADVEAWILRAVLRHCKHWSMDGKMSFGLSLNVGPT